ncbi:MAG: hypothetical protein H8E21_02485 [Gammaproteobacteria bacterium]|nr:hypothetical protein [Gammaproteobacteria bacterium]
MQKPWQKIFQFLYGPIFAVLDFFMRNYRSNRQRLGMLLSNKKVASVLQGAAILLLIIWIFIFVLAPEESRDKLTEAVQQGFGELKTLQK